MNNQEHKAVVKHLTDSGVTEFQAHYVALAIEYAIGSPGFKNCYGTHGVKYLNDFVAQSLPADVYEEACDLYDAETAEMVRTGKFPKLKLLPVDDEWEQSNREQNEALEEAEYQDMCDATNRFYEGEQDGAFEEVSVDILLKTGVLIGK